MAGFAHCDPEAGLLGVLAIDLHHQGGLGGLFFIVLSVTAERIRSRTVFMVLSELLHQIWCQLSAVLTPDLPPQ